MRWCHILHGTFLQFTNKQTEFVELSRKLKYVWRRLTRYMHQAFYYVLRVNLKASRSDVSSIFYRDFSLISVRRRRVSSNVNNKTCRVYFTWKLLPILELSSTSESRLVEFIKYAIFDVARRVKPSRPANAVTSDNLCIFRIKTIKE
jgi:hypothetical protein